MTARARFWLLVADLADAARDRCHDLGTWARRRYHRARRDQTRRRT